MSDGGTVATGESFGRLQDFTIDQFGGFIMMVLGAVGSLLLIIWKSRCKCRCRLGFSDTCYIFDCVREPPVEGGSSDDEGKGDVAKANIARDKQQQQKKEDDDDGFSSIPEELIPSLKEKAIEEVIVESSPEPEPEPEPETFTAGIDAPTGVKIGD